MKNLLFFGGKFVLQWILHNDLLKNDFIKNFNCKFREAMPVTNIISSSGGITLAIGYIPALSGTDKRKN
jgi:hypothetical protein